MKIGFVTCESSKLAYYFPTRAEPLLVPTELPFTPDDQLAVNALRERGHEVSAVQWGKSLAALGDFDLIVVRSPWDYMDTTENISQFFKWIERIEKSGIAVANPSRFMRWLLDKHYMADLAKQGVAVIPAEYFDVNSQLDLLNIFQQRGAYILKPCISAAGVGLYYIDSAHAAQQCQNDVSQALAARTYMLQEFVPEIVTQGEWSLIFIGGRYSHAIHKSPAPNEIMVHAERGGALNLQAQPPGSVIDFANYAYTGMLKAYASVTGGDIDHSNVIYLRLDVIESVSGPVLLECEGVEPELFFRARQQSLFEFADALTDIAATRLPWSR